MTRSTRSKRKAEDVLSPAAGQSKAKKPAKSNSNIENNYVDEPLSQYELIRQRNIENRERLFHELKLGEAIQQVKLSSPAITKAKPSMRGLAAAKKEPKPALPERKSLRLQRIDPETGLQLPEREPTMYHVTSVEDRPRLALTNLTLKDVADWRTISAEDEEDYSKLVETKASYLKELIDSLVIKDKAMEKKVSLDGDLEKVFQRLTVSPETVSKVTPSRIFSMAIHPSPADLLVAAGDKWGAIGLWRVNDVTSESHGVQVLYPHVSPINCLTFSPFDSNRLISTSYDGTVRSFDLEKQEFSLIYGTDEDDGRAYTGYHSQLTPETFLISLGRSGIVGLIDTRVSALKMTQNFRIYDGVSPRMATVHPVKSELFITSNTRTECGIYDMRKPSTGNKLMVPLTSLTGHTKALSSAQFSPITGNNVATVCYDNKLRIYDIAGFPSKLSPKVQIYHNNQTGKWLTTFKAEWHPRRDDLFFVGSMSAPRQMDAYTASGEHHRLSGEFQTTICSIVKVHPSLDVVAGGNSSGRVFVYK